ncbi:MAG: stage III sporulation protein SpoIIIAB [Bacillota bacterium]|nr:stage III sporulation protein SpoIIIAB [Bacillota bacterium]
MLKIIGCILILIGTTTVGFKYAERFNKRVKELYELERAVLQLQNEIVYTHTPLPEILYNVANKTIAPINEIFKNISEILYLNQVNDVNEAFVKIFLEYKSALNLKKEDIDVVLDMSKMLGESDVDSHKRIFSLTMQNLSRQIKTAEDSMKKSVKMYRYLGFSLGAAVVIMLI